MKGNGWVSLLAVLAALGVTMGIAYAASVAVNRTVPAGVSVSLQSNPEGALGFYSDAAGTVAVTALSFGELKPGTTGTTRIYIKNLTGTTSFRYFTAADDFVRGVASISPGDLNLTTLIPGQSRAFDLFLNLDPDIPVGAYLFNITVTASTP